MKISLSLQGQADNMDVSCIEGGEIALSPGVCARATSHAAHATRAQQGCPAAAAPVVPVRKAPPSRGSVNSKFQAVSGWRFRTPAKQGG